jgi:hypothetical protein
VSVEFTNGFFLDIENILVCTSDGFAYLFALPDKYYFLYFYLTNEALLYNLVLVQSVNPQSASFRQKLGSSEVGKFYVPRLVHKFTSTLSANDLGDNRFDNHSKVTF